MFRALLCPNQQQHLEATPTYSLAYLAVALILLLVPVIGIPIHIDEQMLKAPAFSV